ncbi:oxidoreductase-like domain-containing protein [Ideonella sp.]|uniref:oxidoreductase-like domain-containing protein n=1 Tax=Ideonella sp. TaxID=1929293 RepID=UPI003BB6490A
MQTSLDLDVARRRIAELRSQLAALGLSHRDPPPEPDTCCGRGCNGCVWESYFAALDYWCEQAQARLSA